MCQITKECVCDMSFFLSKDSEQEIISKYQLDGLFDQYIKEVFETNKLTPDTEKKLFHSVYQPLKEAVNEGYGQIETKVEYGTPNYEFLKNLQYNTGLFSVFKNHAMIKEVVGKLKDSDGNLKPFNDFKNDVLKTDAKYRQSWLRTEYDTAVRTARMAAQWERIQRTKHLYPNLEYIRSKAAQPSTDHLELVGTILPVDDPFWNTYYPPSRWNCQCSVRQTDKGTTDIPDDLPEVPKELAFNAGKTGEIFKLEATDYIKAASKAEMPKLIKFAKKEVDKDKAKNEPYYNYYSSKSGGKIEVHPLSVEDLYFQENLSVAKLMAHDGKKIKILPIIHDEDLRNKILPVSKIIGKSNPDYLIDGLVFDLKTPKSFSKRAIKSTLEEAKRQCNNVIINITDKNTISLDEIVNTVKGKLNTPEMKKFGKVWINYKGKMYYELIKKPTNVI